MQKKVLRQGGPAPGCSLRGGASPESGQQKEDSEPGAKVFSKGAGKMRRMADASDKGHSLSFLISDIPSVAIANPQAHLEPYTGEKPKAFPFNSPNVTHKRSALGGCASLSS